MDIFTGHQRWCGVDLVRLLVPPTASHGISIQAALAPVGRTGSPATGSPTSFSGEELLRFPLCSPTGLTVPSPGGKPSSGFTQAQGSPGSSLLRERLRCHHLPTRQRHLSHTREPYTPSTHMHSHTCTHICIRLHTFAHTWTHAHTVGHTHILDAHVDM